MTAQLTRPASTPTRPRHARARRSWKPPLTRMALILVLLLVAAIGWIAYSGLRAKANLLHAANDVATLQSQAQNGDVAGERVSLARLQRESHSARLETAGPIWKLAGRTPFVGSNAAAITTVAAAVDGLAQHALPSLVDASAGVDLQAIAPHNGRIDLSPIQHAAPAVVEAAAAVKQMRDQVASISTSGLLPVVRKSVQQLQSDLDSASTTTSTAARAVTLLPSMLGASQPRTYAVLFQNNAELRATGGIAGSWAVVRVDHGALQIVKQGSAGDINSRVSGVPVPPNVAALYTNRPGTFFQDVDMTPSFPTDAAFASEMFKQAYGIDVDGVISTDPVALAGLLKATGPVQLPLGGSLTASNAVSLLLSQVYRNIQDPHQEDVFFAQAASAVFTALSAGQGDARATVKALAAAAGAGRLTVWSQHPDEEKLLAGTELEGVMPATEQPGSPTIGVFLNGGTASKLDYYLRENVGVTPASCPAGQIGLARSRHADVDRPHRRTGTARIRDWTADRRRAGWDDGDAGRCHRAARRRDRVGHGGWCSQLDGYWQRIRSVGGARLRQSRTWSDENDRRSARHRRPACRHSRAWIGSTSAVDPIGRTCTTAFATRLMYERLRSQRP